MGCGAAAPSDDGAGRTGPVELRPVLPVPGLPAQGRVREPDRPPACTASCAARGTTVFLDPTTMEPWPDQWAFLSSVARMAPDAVEALAETLRPVDTGPALSLAELAKSRWAAPPPVVDAHGSAAELSIERAGPATGGRCRVEAPGVDRQPGVLREAADAVLHLGHTPLHRATARISSGSTYPGAGEQGDRPVQRAWQPPRHLDDRPEPPRDASSSSKGPRCDPSRQPRSRTSSTTSSASSSPRPVRARPSWPAPSSLTIAPRPSSWSIARSSSTSGATGSRPPRPRPCRARPDRWRQQQADRRHRRRDDPEPRPTRRPDPCSTATGSSWSTSATTSLPCRSRPACVPHGPDAGSGLTATPYRRDKLEAHHRVPMRTDPPRDQTRRGRGHRDSVRRELIVHPTATEVSRGGGCLTSSTVFRMRLSEDEQRTAQICADVHDACSAGRTCLVLTQRTEHIDAIVTGLDRARRPRLSS
jgi:hypothetical protein